jgi:hypothetical protein
MSTTAASNPRYRRAVGIALPRRRSGRRGRPGRRRHPRPWRARPERPPVLSSEGSGPDDIETPVRDA